MGGGAHPVAAPGKPQSEGCREFDPVHKSPGRERHVGGSRVLARPRPRPSRLGLGGRGSGAGGGVLFPPGWGPRGVAWRLRASRLPNPACKPACCRARPSCLQEPVLRRGVSGKRANQEHDESGERGAACCSPAPAAPAPGPTQQGWSERAPLGAGTCGDLGSAVQATSLLALACGWHEAGDLLCGHGPSRSPGPSCGPLAALLDAAAGPWSPTVRFHR